MDKTVEISLAKRLMFGAATAILGFIVVGFIGSLCAAKIAPDLSLKNFWPSLLLSLTGMFLFGMAAPNLVKQLLISASLSASTTAYDEDDYFFD